MDINITIERLLELGSSLNEIMQELSTAVEAPQRNPKKRVPGTRRQAHYANLIDNQTSGVKRKIKLNPKNK